jgi:soluble lytic murein transglycosylase-like protein
MDSAVCYDDCSMRRWAVVVVLGLVAGAARADVHLVVKSDGRKLIYNVGGGGGKASDYKWLSRQRDRRSGFDPIIERYSDRYHVDPVLVRAVIQVESNFNPACISRKGARGLMQLMPATAQRYGVKKIHDPDENIRGGVRYLRDLLDMFPNDLQRVLAAYNAGENAVLRFGGIPPYEETTTYVRRALTVYHGRPWGGAVSFAGRRGKNTLRGGITQPVIAAAVAPGVRYLGTIER